MKLKKNPWTLAIAAPLALAALFTVAALWMVRSDRPQTTESTSKESADGRNVHPTNSVTPDGVEVISPWNATPENTPDAGPGFTPAWQVKLPPPPPVVPPPPVDAPRDPQSTSQPAPNTVEGDRPVRTIPGTAP